MSNLLLYREKLNLTQEELAEKSGISVRTIQRIEAGTQPKGFTLKALSKALEIDSKLLLENYSKQEKLNYSLIKLINLSYLLFVIPFANIIVPLLIMYQKKQINSFTKQIISIQILWTISVAFLIFISPFIQRLFSIENSLILIVLMLSIVSNLYIIIRNVISLDKQKNLHIKLNFSFL